MNIYKGVGLFASGVLIGSAGFKLLSSKDAKKVYTQTTAAVLRMKDCTMQTVNKVQEEAGDILADAFGFGLCKPCVDDQIEFAVDLQCVYILLLEVDANPSCPEHSDLGQAVHCITFDA